MFMENFMKDGNDVVVYDRRSMLKRILAVGGVPILYTVFASPAVLADATGGGLADTDLAKAFMARAVEMRRIAVQAGDQPYGAIVVKGKEIVGEGPSRVITDKDPTAHAEVVAIIGMQQGALVHTTLVVVSCTEHRELVACARRRPTGRTFRNLSTARELWMVEYPHTPRVDQ